jgi:hypothetical protein
MEYNFVTNSKIVQVFKSYKNFRVQLGFANFVDKGDPNGFKSLNDKDDFAYFYNKRYNTTIYGQGRIGDISIYTDHYIHEDVIAIYVGKEEFIFDFSFDVYREKGIEWYLGSFLKQVDTEMEKLKTEQKLKKEEEKPVGNPYKLVYGHPEFNPGSVTFEDVKAYQAAKLAGKIK